jgi:hypothetical protein
LQESLWLVVFFQSILLVLCLHLFLNAFFCFPYLKKYLLGLYLFVVGVPTALSFHVSCLMPDMFTPIVLLSFLMLLLADNQTKREKVGTIVLFLVASVMHNIHLLLCVAFICLLWCSYVFPKLRRKWYAVGVRRDKLLGLSGLTCIALLSLCSLHYVVAGEFRAARGGGIFLFARLCDYGIAQDYLQQNCEGKYHYLCLQQDKLGQGRHFLWDRQKILHRHGGWTSENEAMYSRLCVQILSQPNYLKKYLLKTLIASFRQFFCYDFSPLDENHHAKWLANEVARRFPDALNEVQNNQQYLGVYRPEMADVKNSYQHFLVLFSLLVLGMLWFFSVVTFNRFWLWTAGLFLGLYLNAFVSAATSGVYPRYQSRIAWLLTLPSFWVLCQYIQAKWAKLKAAPQG